MALPGRARRVPDAGGPEQRARAGLQPAGVQAVSRLAAGSRRDQPAPGDAAGAAAADGGFDPLTSRGQSSTITGSARSRASPSDRSSSQRGKRGHRAEDAAGVRSRPGRRHAGFGLPGAGRITGRQAPAMAGGGDGDRPGDRPSRRGPVWMEGERPDALPVLRGRRAQRDGHHQPTVPRRDLPPGGLLGSRLQPSAHAQRPRRSRHRTLHRVHALPRPAAGSGADRGREAGQRSLRDDRVRDLPCPRWSPGRTPAGP
jgi:hypothetical protein